MQLTCLSGKSESSPKCKGNSGQENRLNPYSSCGDCFSTGDVAGIGWERTEGTPPPPGQPAKGRVYFTYCGQRLGPYLEDVSGGMWPVVHIQKKASF